MESLLAFAATALILTMVPGLDTALVMRTAATGGRRHGAFAALGIGVGCLCWGAAVALGLGALLAASSTAFVALRWVGATYLLWLGVGLLRRGDKVAAAPGVTPPTEMFRHAFRRGFTTNILNPKVGLFYLTLVPQFVPAGAPVALYSLLLASVHVALAILWFVTLAVGIGSIGPALRRPRVARGLDVTTAVIFLGFGAKLILARHA
jgi:threonine/homoserine/homoserine lactone efflux protein